MVGFFILAVFLSIHIAIKNLLVFLDEGDIILDVVLKC